MHRWIPLFLALAATASAVTAPEREAAFQSLQDDARATRLLDQAAADIKARHFAPALEKSLAAEALRPNDPVVLNTKGAALTELGRYEEASRTLDAAIAADPTAFAPQFNQGELLSLQKNYVDAGLQFALLQSRFGAIPLLKYKIYLCYILARRADLAEAALRELRYPEDGAAWYYAHAVDLLQAGKRRDARDLVAAARAIHPKDDATYLDTLRVNGLLP